MSFTMEIPDDRLNNPAVARQVLESYYGYIWRHDPETALRARLPRLIEQGSDTATPQVVGRTIVKLAETASV